MFAVGWLVAATLAVVLLWFRSQLMTTVQSARLLGMQEAADSLVRGLSPYYEGADQTVPGNVVNAITVVGEAVDKAKGDLAKGNAYQSGLMILGDAIGQACVDKHRKS
jgi:hypothetical protein